MFKTLYTSDKELFSYRIMQNSCANLDRKLIVQNQDYPSNGQDEVILAISPFIVVALNSVLSWP
jgi:hypothetical protein